MVILLAVDNRKQVLITLFDYGTAFDTIDHAFCSEDLNT